MDRFDLGTHTKQVSTTSAEAQKWCDLGLNWCFGFNHEEGVKCFERALEHDPECVMGHWGAAYGAGPFYNYLWRAFNDEEATQATAYCHAHIIAGRRFAHTAEPWENALLEALARRFQQPHPVSGEEYDRWDHDYANAMREVYRHYPDDHDIAAIFAEAMMTRHAWKLWDRQGRPTEGADTLEALAVIERSIAMCDAHKTAQHPAILHLHIHATEMSSHPERAMRSADMLGEICPDAGHMNHMPGHTYVLCGEYQKAKIASEKAIGADDLYVDYAGPYNFYTTARCHDLHLMMYSCMLMGQFTPAWDAARKMSATLSPDVLRTREGTQMEITMEGYSSMMMHVLVRFGRWQEILAEPFPEDRRLYCVSTAMQHYARGVAFAALKQFSEAAAEQAAFHQAVAVVPEDRVFFNNPARVILAIGEKMLEGELHYHQGNYPEAFASLRESVYRDDRLAYSEPWPWMHPPRHALAALLSAQGQYTEAEEVYRADLGLNDTLQRCAQHPDNVWALHGLVECLKHRGETQELPSLEEKLRHAQSLADVPITSSCLCRMQGGGGT